MIASCLIACAITIGGFFSTYSDDSFVTNQELGAHARIGGNLFVWGSYDSPSKTLVGQRLATVDTWGAGIGYQHDFSEKVYGVLELGYFMPKAKTTKQTIRDEAVWTQLVFEHNRGGTGPNWHPKHTTYALDKNWGGKLGIGFRLRKWLAMEARYVFRSYPEDYDACTGGDPTCDFPVAPGEKHWQNRRASNANAVEAGITVRF